MQANSPSFLSFRAKHFWNLSKLEKFLHNLWAIPHCFTPHFFSLFLITSRDFFQNSLTQYFIKFNHLALILIICYKISQISSCIITQIVSFLHILHLWLALFFIFYFFKCDITLSHLSTTLLYSSHALIIHFLAAFNFIFMKIPPSLPFFSLNYLLP